MKTRQQIIESNPLPRIMRDYGITVPTTKQAMVKCPFHEDGNASMSVNTEAGLFHCHGCGCGGSVIDFIAIKENIPANEVMRRLGDEPEPFRPAIVRNDPPEASKPLPGARGRVVDTYSYTDELGRELYQVVRMDPKDFRQRHQGANGHWVWNMQDVRRVLYRLPSILKTNQPYVWVVEGEKDVDNLRKCGYTGTCNVGGAGKWMDGYSECLKGKEVILCGDNDEPGRKHMEKVFESVCKIAKSVRKIEVPAPHKDVSDYIATFGDELELAAKSLFDIIEAAPVLTGGVVVPVQTFAELEREYVEHVKDSETSTLDLGKWIQKLGREVRGLVPGELVVFLADTGVGKTACLQNLAIHAAPVQTLLFELELPGTLTFERFVSISNQLSSRTVNTRYRNNETVDWKATGKLNHISVCSQSRLSPMDIERIIIQTELKTGNKPRIVLLDYVGLVQGQGKSKYEKVSMVAEELKVIAKATKTIIVVASQVARKERDSGDITLHDGKDSGSIENSAGLVIGLWRDKDNKSIMKMKVLKNTKGTSGFIVDCDFCGETMTITQRSPIDWSDVPPMNPHND